jgi:hemoglobin/transferrin/lactoferrin receptor protein
MPILSPQLPRCVAASILSICQSSQTTLAEQGIHLETQQITATRTTLNSFDIPTAVTTVNSDEIDRQIPQIVPDLLRGQTGVFVQETTPGQGIPIVRGLKGSEVLYLVDGIRLSNAIFRNSPNQYMAFLDPFNVEQIEVVRGASSTLYGSDAMGGVVNVLTHTPHFSGAHWQHSAIVNSSYASAANAFQNHLKLSAGKDDIAVLGGFGYQDFDNRTAGNDEDQPFTGYKSWAGNAKVVYQPSAAHEFLWDMQFLSQPNTPRFDELVAGYGQTQPSSAVFNFEPNERLFLHGRYRFSQATALFDTLEIHAAHQRITDDRRARDFGDTVESREENASLLTGFTLQASLAHGPDSHLVYGFEFYHDEVTSNRQDTDILSRETETKTSRFPHGSTMDSYAFYGNETLQLGERLQWVLGSRYSHYHTVLAQADRDVGVELQHQDVTGNVGLAYKIIDGLKFVSNFGRGFRAPNIFDLGTLGPRPNNRYNAANTNLQPETVISWDFGFKLQTPFWQAEAIGYRSDYRDKITTVLTGDVIDGRDVVQNQNVNRLKLHGAEFGARYFATDRLQIYGNLNYTYGEEIFDDSQVLPADRIPPLNGRLGIYYSVLPSLWLEGYSRFASEQARLSDRDLDDPRINPNGTSGWATLNLRAGWQATRQLKLQLDLENLLDKNYREHGSGVDSAGINAIASMRLQL